MKNFLLFISIALTACAASADPAPLTTRTDTTLTDNHGRQHALFADHQQANLIFIDALCPMPHFPGCEAFIDLLATTYDATLHNSYLVFNTLYVDTDTVADFAAKNQLTLPIIIDAEMELHRRFSIHATPYQITITSSGEVSYRGNKLRLNKE